MRILAPGALLVFSAVALGSEAGSSAGARCLGSAATIVGTGGGDRLVGTGRADVIVGRGGNDRISARGGNDKVCDGGGKDRVSTGGGNDRTGGGPGADRVDGGAGKDRLGGGAGNDVIAGGAGNDRVSGQGGNDRLRGNAGADRLTGGAGTDDCLGGAGTDTILTCETGDVLPPAPGDGPPTAVADAAAVGEDAAAEPIAVLANDTDPDGGPKSIGSVTQPPNGTVAVTGGGAGLTYTPAANYCNSPAGPTDDFSYALAPGGSTTQVAITVTCVNDRPTIATTATPRLYSQGSGPRTIDTGVSAGDVDSANLSGATVRISAGFVGTEDELSFADQLGITGTYDSGTGVLTLTGDAPVGDYQTALRSVAYENTSSTPTLGARTVSFSATDAGSPAETSAPATRDVMVQGPNDAPVVNATATALAYTENDPATVVDSALTVTDAQSDVITAGTASITANFQGGQDALGWVDNNPSDNISLDAASTAQTVVLTGSDSVANYEAALRAVTYANSSDTPATAPRTVTFSVTDEPGDAGTDTRNIDVTAVDDPPVAVDDSATVAEDAPATPVAVLANDTDVDAGPKTVASATDPANGTVVLTGGSPGEHAGLTYQPDPNYCNDGPLAPDDTFTYTLNGGDSATVSMAVTCVNDAPSPDNETFSGAQRAIGNTSLVVDDPSDGAQDPAGPQKTITGDILDGDTDLEGDPVSVDASGSPLTTADGGAVTIQPDGDFVYQPPQGCAGGADDSFAYAATDGQASSNGTVTIAIADCVWYVDDSASAGGDGRSHAPYNSLSDLDGGSGVGDEDGVNHRIFLYDGSYTGGLPLENNQQLTTERHGLAVPDGSGTAATITLEAGDGAGSTLQGGLVLASGNDVQGLDLGTTGSSAVYALSGSSVGEAHVNDSTLGDLNNPAGGAINVAGTGNTLRFNFGTLSSSGSSGNAVSIANAAGVVDANAGTLTNATGTTLSLNGGSLGFTYDGAVSDDSGQLISIANKTSGTTDFNGPVDDVPANANNGGGISLQANGTAVTRFDGGLNLSTGSSNGFVSTNGGTLVVTDPASGNNTIASTTGTALNVSFTTVGDDDLTFQSVASNGAANGIVMQNTSNANGRLVVTGTGATNSGGIIQSSTGAGINLANVPGGVDLTRVAVQNGGDDGIRGDAVGGFALRNSSVTGNGNAAGESGVELGALTGTVVFDTDTVSGSADNNVSVGHASGTLNMSVTNGTYSNTSASLGNDGILVDSTGTGAATLTVNGSTFSNNRGDHVQMSTDNSTSVVQTATIANTNMSTTPLGSATIAGGGITISPSGASNVTATITGNNIQNSISNAIRVDTTSGVVGQPTTSVVNATISSNTIGTAGSARSGSYSGNGIIVGSNGGSTVNALIANNLVRQYTNTHGISLFQGDGTNATLNATIRSNTLSQPSNALGGAGGVTVRAGITSTPAAGGGQDAGVMCLDLGGAGALQNSLSGAGNDLGAGTETDDVFVWQRFGTKIQLPSLGGTTTDAAARTYLINRNLGDGTPSVYTESTPADTGFQNRNTGCPSP